MLNEFHFDHTFLENEILVDIDTMNETLLKKWLNFGCLFYPFSHLQDYLKSLELHDVRYIQEWKTAFSSFKSCNISDNYKQIVDHRDISDLCLSIKNYGVKTTIISKEDANSICMLTKSYNNVGLREVVQTEAISLSLFFNESEKYAQLDIPSNAPIDEVWQTRFQGIANHTNVITIIDRYLKL